jgi:probable HAF family extracellular repeat protein
MVRRTVLVCACILAIASPCAAQYYTVVDLGTLPSGDRGYVCGINESGQIVGSSWTSRSGSSQNHAVLWDNQPPAIDLNVPNPYSARFSKALAINNTGRLTGTAYIGNKMIPVFADTTGNIEPVEMSLAYEYASPMSLNDTGRAVGSVSAGGTIYVGHAAVWDVEGHLTDLGTVPGNTSTRACDINSAGLIVGTASTGYTTHAVVWNPDTTSRMLPELPGTSVSQARGVNDVGEVAGSSGRYPVVWDAWRNPRALNLPSGVTDGYAVRINNHGVVVGQVYNDLSNRWQAAAWTADGTFIDLSLLVDGYSTTVSDINDRGQIVGYSVDSRNIVSRPLLWSPIPEPNTALGMCVGLCVMAMCVSRKRQVSRHHLPSG